MAQCEVPYEEMMMQWLNTQYFDHSMTIQPDLLPLHEDTSYNCLPHLELYNADPCNLYESSPTNHLLQPSLGHQTYHQGIESMAGNLHVMSYFDAGVKEQHASQNFTNEVVETENELQLKGKRKSEINCYERETSDESECISNNVPKKKSRSSVRAPRRGKNCKEESKNGESSSCSSDEELFGELNRNRNTKKDSNSASKANKGSATDPQSLYARKRREKINQRLRILQNLVPNGTKVDISTMLEEAIQYVKFLQTQIKLLSSDDLWMYAPLAYNGVNMNIDLSICQQ